MSQTICLNMIVKNEAAIIEETLANITDHIKLDYYVISDTGSTDDTVGVIRRFFDAKGIAGEIHHDGWQNFAYNRNQALKHAKGKTDYVLIFDADDRFEGKLELPELTVDRYRLRMRNAMGSVVYYRPLLLRNDGTFYWRGVLHGLSKPTNKIPAKPRFMATIRFSAAVSARAAIWRTKTCLMPFLWKKRFTALKMKT